jgi:hypothetical protein
MPKRLQCFLNIFYKEEIMESFEKLDAEFHFSALEKQLQEEIFENTEIIDFFSKPTAIEIKIEKYTENDAYSFNIKIECKSELKKKSAERAEYLADIISDSFLELSENNHGEDKREKLLENFGGATVIFNEKKIY